MKKLLIPFLTLLLFTACTPITVAPQNQSPGKSEPENTQIDQATKSNYLKYTPQNFDQNVDKKRVLFFHASWCPTCKAANIEFENNTDQIPSDVILLKTDYDSQTELKKKYNITYQHTFVYVDSNGNEIKKWNGGGIYELNKNTN